MPKPADWKPPYPAFWPRFSADASVVFSYFAIQTHPAANAQRADFHEWIATAFGAAHGPQHHERGYFIDEAAQRNDVYVGYWRDPAEYRAWRQQPTVSTFWDSPHHIDGDAGYWNETLLLPSGFFEALFSSTHLRGVAALADGAGEPVGEHAYWGAARDRIPALDHGDLPSPHRGATLQEQQAVSRGSRLLIQPPRHLCLIHTAQDWTQCSPSQEQFYLHEVQPSLEQGLGFLATHAPETGCIVSRYVRELDADGRDTRRTYGMCYFLEFKHLEDWAREHPTHLRIYGNFMRMAQTFAFDVQLRLWHQVAVLPPGGPMFEYINCHPRTGLIRHFGAPF